MNSVTTSAKTNRTRGRRGGLNPKDRRRNLPGISGNGGEWARAGTVGVVYELLPLQGHGEGRLPATAGAPAIAGGGGGDWGEAASSTEQVASVSVGCLLVPVEVGIILL
jgi:hypothetical protein